METSMNETQQQAKETVFRAPDRGDLQATATVDREVRRTVGEARVTDPRIRCNDINVYYGTAQAIKNVNLDVGRNEVLAMIGPSGCGKSTFLRCLNRMNDTINGCRVTGDIRLDGVENVQPAVNHVGDDRADRAAGVVGDAAAELPAELNESLESGPQEPPPHRRGDHQGGLRAEIVAGQHSVHARHRQRLADVVGFDARMRMRAAEDRAVQHAGAVEIGDVVRAAFHLLAHLGARQRGADRFQWGAHGFASRTAAATASTILR